MENQAVDAAMMAGSVGADQFTMISMFLRADVVVKSVMVILVLASIWCWAIIFEKLLTVRRLNKRSSEFEQAFWSGKSLDDLFDRVAANPRDPMAAVFSAAMREWRRVSGSGSSSFKVGLSERIDRVMQITVHREMDRAEKYMTFLATTGATAPFVGLFGTV